MERFRLRARHEPQKGLIWELKLFPDHPRRVFREADGRVLGEHSAPASVLWLKRIASDFLERADDPVNVDDFGPNSEPRWLRADDGMRLALAFSAARYLSTPAQRRQFRDELKALPTEVVLYWFTLCFYGYRQSAGRAALRTLLTYEEPGGGDSRSSTGHRRRPAVTDVPDLFAWKSALDEVSAEDESEEQLGDK